MTKSVDNNIGFVDDIVLVILGEKGVSGAGTLLSVTLSANKPGAGYLRFRNVQLGDSTGQQIYTRTSINRITVYEGAPWDVNRDGTVDILDLIQVSSHIGSTEEDFDVNSDGEVNILDITVVAGHLGESTTPRAPFLSSDMVREWIDMAQTADDGSLVFQEGIANLERLLTALLPEETVLLPNYPNPFNPETWIPYQLAHDTNVTLTIYDIKGAVVRRLDLGHQIAGYYADRIKAAYWDGRNNLGEPVGSGVYFYQLQAEDFSAIRKMVILK